MKNKGFRKNLIILLTTVFFIFTSSTVFSASACKGGSKSQCGVSDCTWVNGYKKKDGSKVKGYCRSKSKSSKNNKGKEKKKESKVKDKSKKQEKAAKNA